MTTWRKKNKNKKGVLDWTLGNMGSNLTSDT